MKKIAKLGAGETAFVEAAIPPGANVEITLTADCACGGRMIPRHGHPREYVCDRSHWWNRKKHAHLVIEIAALPKPGGTA